MLGREGKSQRSSSTTGIWRKHSCGVIILLLNIGQRLRYELFLTICLCQLYRGIQILLTKQFLFFVLLFYFTLLWGGVSPREEISMGNVSILLQSLLKYVVKREYLKDKLSEYWFFIFVEETLCKITEIRFLLLLPLLCSYSSFNCYFAILKNLEIDGKIELSSCTCSMHFAFTL